MYVIVEIAGQQFKVEEGQNIFVHNLNTEEGAEITFDKVLLVDNDGQVKVGSPVVEGASVTVSVIDPLVKGEKVIVFKKKRRKGYKKKNGHRQQFTKVNIKSIKA